MRRSSSWKTFGPWLGDVRAVAAKTDEEIPPRGAGRHIGRVRLAIQVVLLLCGIPASAPAQQGPGRERQQLRLELAPSASIHADSLRATAFDADTSGQTLAHVRLEADAFPWNRPLGFALRFEVERAAMRSAEGPFGELDLAATGLSVAAGFAGRREMLGRLEVRAMLGYGFEQAPMLWLPDGGLELEVASVRAHGPVLGAALRTAVGRRAAIELRAVAVPFTSGGVVAATDLSMARWRGGLAMLLRGGRGAWRWAASAGYDLERTSISGTGVDMTGWKHLLSLGLELQRVKLAPEPSAVAPPVAPPPPAPVATGRVRGFVRAASGGAVAGLAIAGATVQARGLPPVQSARDGAFVIENAPPGPLPLSVRAAGWKPLDEVVSVPAGGEATIDLALLAGHTSELAVIRGVVRSSIDGAPVSASIAVPQLALQQSADAAGSFVVLAPPGELTLRISAPGFEEQIKTLVVGRGEQAILNVDLQPASEAR